VYFAAIFDLQLSFDHLLDASSSLFVCQDFMVALWRSGYWDKRDIFFTVGLLRRLRP